VKYNVDFRSVFAGVLENWLKTKSLPVLGKQFTPLPWCDFLPPALDCSIRALLPGMERVRLHRL